jgi:hypothetical protein
MTFWHPHASPVRYILLVLPLLTIPVAVWLWVLLVERAAVGDYGPHMFLYGLGLFLTLVLFGMLVYLAWCAFTIGYTIDVHDLTVRVGGVRHVIPLSSITAVYPPGERVGDGAVQVRWSALTDVVPGYLVGAGSSPQLGTVVGVSTLPVAGQMFVQTRGWTYGISPARPLAFVEDLNKRRAAAQLDEVPFDLLEPTTGSAQLPRVALRGVSAWGAGLWGDRTARYMLLAGLALCALFFGYMSLVYSSLPSRLPMHWNAQAQVDRIGDPQELLRLPAFALAVWLGNVVLGWWAFRRERAATLFLLAGAVAAQVVFAAGALSIVLRNQ